MNSTTTQEKGTKSGNAKQSGTKQKKSKQSFLQQASSEGMGSLPTGALSSSRRGRSSFSTKASCEPLSDWEDAS